jgi:hypothetical protein
MTAASAFSLHVHFKANFERHAAVKAKDPDDFFWNEQSIPPIPSSRNGLLGS